MKAALHMAVVGPPAPPGAPRPRRLGHQHGLPFWVEGVVPGAMTSTGGAFEAGVRASPGVGALLDVAEERLEVGRLQELPRPTAPPPASAAACSTAAAGPSGSAARGSAAGGSGERVQHMQTALGGRVSST